MGCGILDLPIILPQESYIIELESSPWHSLWKTCSAREIFLTITGILKHPTRWAKDGHVLASTQLSLSTEDDSIPHVLQQALLHILLLPCVILYDHLVSFAGYQINQQHESDL